MNTRTQSKHDDINVDDLKKDIHQLRDDLSKLSRAVIDKQNGQVSHLRDEISKSSRDALRQVGERSEEALNKARDISDRTVKDIEHRVQERPFVTLLLVFCAGLILGKFVDRASTEQVPSE